VAKRELPPIHLGEILLEECLDPMGSTQYRLAKDIRVDPRRINEIVHDQHSITADTAFRLGRYSGMSPQFWLNLQSHYDLEVLDMECGDQIKKEVSSLTQAFDDFRCMLFLTSRYSADEEMSVSGQPPLSSKRSGGAWQVALLPHSPDLGKCVSPRG
jgi:addiction module HigA family antidote